MRGGGGGDLPDHHEDRYNYLVLGLQKTDAKTST